MARSNMRAIMEPIERAPKLSPLDIREIKLEEMIGGKRMLQY